jgi:hypothetical protein
MAPDGYQERPGGTATHAPIPALETRSSVPEIPTSCNDVIDMVNLTVKDIVTP